MGVITDWGQAFLTAITDAFRNIFAFLPQFIGALIILLIGWWIAGLLAKLITNVLRKIRFNDATRAAGLDKIIQSAGVKTDASGVMGEIVKWFFRIIALVAAFSVLQLPALTAALTGILNFIPRLFVALVILLIGAMIANFVANFVKGAATSAGFSNANLVSNVARYAILYITVIAALSQIGVAETVINTLFIGTVAALVLALGIAFGIGGRDTAAKIWENTYNSAQKNLPRISAAAKYQAQTTAKQVEQNQPRTQPQMQYQQASQQRPQQPAQPQYNQYPPQYNQPTGTSQTYNPQRNPQQTPPPPTTNTPYPSYPPQQRPQDDNGNQYGR